MQHKRTLIGSVSCLILAAGVAQADVITFDVTNGDWNVAGNWDTNSVPTAADRAVIPSGKTCTIKITTAVADTIDVEGTLNINAGKKLTLDNGSDNVEADPDNSQVNGNGKVVLIGSGSILRFDLYDHEVIGDGEIEGLADDTKIEIAADVILINRLGEEGTGRIHHRLAIVGLTGGTDNGTFNNWGIVHAHTGGTLLLSKDTILDDDDTSGAPKWTASRGGKLKFDRDAKALVGAFELNCNELVFAAEIRTCGVFRYGLGLVTIDTGGLFAYGSFSTGVGGCTNPGGAPSFRDCTKYEITSTASCGACGG